METITFYSYKGGSGRSLLVANAARYLALLGKRVVAIDFDLEAPGLHYKFNVNQLATKSASAVPNRGVVDYLLAVLQNEKTIPRLSDLVLTVPLPRGTKGKLYLLPAGSAPSGDYWKALTKLLRRDAESGSEDGIAACLELKARIQEELKADFILIDSRTGITEMAGLATTLLADKVVCLMILNRESLIGTRAVLRSLSQAPRFRSQKRIEILPVLSRVPKADDDTRNETLKVLNEPGPFKGATLSLDRIYVLRVDPDLATEEKVHVGGENANRSPLYQDYLALFEAMVTADPGLVSAAARRHEAISEMKEWLTEGSDSRRYRSRTPDSFDEEQIAEGVEVGSGDKRRYADLMAYGDKDRSERLLAVEYVDDLDGSKAWQWWAQNTDLRCVVLIGKEDGRYLKKRIFTRGKRSRNLIERDDTSGWMVKWPASFSSLDDPGDRTVDSMLRAVQRGDDSFIGLLVTEWQHSSFATLHGGSPYRPKLAKRIVHGLAQVTDLETEARILWRTMRDPFGRDFERFGPEGGELESLMEEELHAPLWWRLSVAAKKEVWSHRGPKRGGEHISAGMDMLVRDLMGLRLDQDRDFRRDVREIIGNVTSDDDSDVRFYAFAREFRNRELKLEVSETAPPELVRRIAFDLLLKGDQDGPDAGWELAEQTAYSALRETRSLSRLLRGPNQTLQFVTMNLLGAYDPETGRILIYQRLVEWCAEMLGVDARAIANVTFMHCAVYAASHLGRDLDEHFWDNFGLPPAKAINYKPNLALENLARFFTSRLLDRLADATLNLAFERLNTSQPKEYQEWQSLKHAPVEEVRKLLLGLRASDSALWGFRNNFQYPH